MAIVAKGNLWTKKINNKITTIIIIIAEIIIIYTDNIVRWS